MKWSAPIQQVQVVEVGQEGSQNKETLFPQSGTKWPGGVCLSGRTYNNRKETVCTGLLYCSGATPVDFLRHTMTMREDVSCRGSSSHS